MKPPPKKIQKRNITGLRNQFKAHTATAETGNEALKVPPGTELDSTTRLESPSLELADEENPDKDWDPEVHFNSMKPFWELEAEESDEDERQESSIRCPQFLS
ncbi:hypothetical protein C0992_008154, partial [Termitomyces sp. T32_za158]